MALANDMTGSNFEVCFEGRLAEPLQASFRCKHLPIGESISRFVGISRSSEPSQAVLET